ncbi:MAG: single-stranded DNA-binding protein [Bacteroidota bacterium]|nr:single-stranded DNA-binding protein [Bacteroidota bacterium]
MELTGRVTKDAVIKTLPDERQVVDFSIAINEYHKPKGAAERKQKTFYAQCAYWQNTSIAKYLLKGAVVQVEGRMDFKVYAGKDGEPKVAANFHCRRVQVFGVMVKKEMTGEAEEVANNEAKSN